MGKRDIGEHIDNAKPKAGGPNKGFGVQEGFQDLLG
jgi:hypothetical protein